MIKGTALNKKGNGSKSTKACLSRAVSLFIQIFLVYIEACSHAGTWAHVRASMPAVKHVGMRLYGSATWIMHG